jgi:hypothetical protein
MIRTYAGCGMRMGAKEPMGDGGSTRASAERKPPQAPALAGILIGIFTLALVGYLIIAILTFLAVGGG